MSVECGPKSVKIEISDPDLTNNEQFGSVASGFFLQGQRLEFLSNMGPNFFIKYWSSYCGDIFCFKK